MAPLDKPLALIDTADITRLVDDGVIEGQTIDYKELLPGNSEGDRKEFLADVSSFANTTGGHIIYGIPETRDAAGQPTGIPAHPIGLSVSNFDKLRNDLANRCQDGLAPRVNGLEFLQVDGFANGSVLVLRVPSSLSSPHMITYQHWSRTYARNAGGKYIMDWDQIRRAFLLGADAIAEIRKFHDLRVRVVSEGAGQGPPVAFRRSGPKIILHLVPLSTTARSAVIDMQAEARQMKIRPMGHTSYNTMLNFEGLVSFYGQPGQVEIYTQLFRNGALEGVDAFMLDDTDLIPSAEFEQDLIGAVDHYLAVQRALEIPPPWGLFLTVVGVNGFGLGIRNGKTATIQRSILEFPEIFVSDAEQAAHEILHPLFDILWQTFNLPRSPNYDSAGIWNPQRR